MSEPLYFPLANGAGYGWSVATRDGARTRIVSGPYTSRDAATAEAVRLSVAEPAGAEPADTRPGPCAECGHLHYLGPRDGYTECPVDGCDCAGQAWAQSAALRASRGTPADVLAAVAESLRALALQADRYDAELAELRESHDTLRADVGQLQYELHRMNSLGSVRA